MKSQFIIVLSFATLFMSCASKEKSKSIEMTGSASYTELYRPQFHFSPPINWINDPNGLVYHQGEYHLFYQYNPYGTTWGHMSWGHAVSKDLLHWENLPLAIAEYQDEVTGDSTMIFSGTAVVDKTNSSGLGKDCLVAIFTSNVHKGNQGLRQHQSLAYSNDRGRSWKLYDKNPILDIQRKDFRDPKVFWYEPDQKWVMALVVPDLFKVQFYQSKNLLKWNLMSEFGQVGDTTRVWECPDLYPLPVENEKDKSKWVLSLSGGHPAGPTFVGMQYFVGDFDGTNFTSAQTKAKYIDYGKDFYAGIVYNNIPAEDGRTMMIGWINNWTYGNQIPTSLWRGAMSLPRQLTLKSDRDGYQLVQKIIDEAKSIRGSMIDNLEENKNGSIEIELEWNGSAGAILELFANGEEKTVIGQTREGSIYLDRRQSGITDFQSDFASSDQVTVEKGSVNLHIFVDQSIVEVFINDGEASITSQVFPRGENKINIPLKENIVQLKAWELKSIWK